MIMKNELPGSHSKTMCSNPWASSQSFCQSQSQTISREWWLADVSTTEAMIPDQIGSVSNSGDISGSRLSPLDMILW